MTMATVNSPKTILDELTPRYSIDSTRPTIPGLQFIADDTVNKQLYLAPAGFSKGVTPYGTYEQFDKELQAQYGSRQTPLQSLYHWAETRYTNMAPMPLGITNHKVHLVKEQNPYDPDALLMVFEFSNSSEMLPSSPGVHVQRKQLGYVPKAVSAKIRKNLEYIKPGLIWRVVKSQMGGNPKPLYNVIVVFDYDLTVVTVPTNKGLGRFKRVVI